jgi:hypothetical protein
MKKIMLNAYIDRYNNGIAIEATFGLTLEEAQFYCNNNTYTFAIENRRIRTYNSYISHEK